MMRILTRLNAAMLALFASLLIVLMLSGCVSTHEVKYEEVNQDGSYISTWVRESVPPGGKKLSEGETQAGVAADGSWDLVINGRAETDAERTAEFYRAIVAEAIKAGIAAGLAAAAAGAAPAIPGP